MKTTQQLFTAKDHLVSKDRFKVIWNNDKHWAQTEIPLGTDMSKYYKSDDYASHKNKEKSLACLLYTSPSPRDATLSRMPSSA